MKFSHKVTPLNPDNSATMENVAPGTMRAVSKELRDLTQHPLEGVSLCVNESDVTDITANIAGPGYPLLLL